MNFWDTVAGYRLAEVLTHNLPKIADIMNKNQRKPQQHIKQIAACELHNYLVAEMEAGRRLVQAMPVHTANGDDYVVVTE